MSVKIIDDVEINASDDEQERVIKIINDKAEYKRLKEKYEKKWFKLGSPACFAQEDEEGNILFKSAKEVQHYFEHIRVSITENGKKKSVGFYERWKKDPTIRYYEKIVFKPPPLQVIQGEYNLFNGCQVKEAKIVPIDEFIEVLQALVNYDEYSFEYQCNYYGDIIQNPARQNKSHSRSIIYRGEQGSGKSSIQKIFEKLIGKAYIKHTSDINSILKSKDNRFADGAVNKIVVCIEETNSNDGYSKADQLKDYI